MSFVYEYSFPTNPILNYARFLTWMYESLESILYEKIASTRYNTLLSTVDINTIVEATPQEQELITQCVSTYSNDFVPTPCYIYKNHTVLNAKISSNSIFQTVSSWTFSGTNVDDKFNGVSVDATISDNVSLSRCHMRIVDVTNVCIVGNASSNTNGPITMMIDVAHLPKKETVLELQACIEGGILSCTSMQLVYL